MTNLTRDPKGYYIALGITEDADSDAVKAAYRSKAKRLHPDFNPSPIAAKQFHRLHEAYQTLSDPAKRAAYDRPWRSGSTQEKAPPKKAKEPPREAPREPPRETQHEAPEPPPQQQKPTASAQANTNLEQPALCKCGKITAQPRYLIFDLVWGRLNKVQRRGISGVFCRSCADKTAIKASLITWLAGWWAWPNGPRETVKALITNMRGGRKPADRNARLLMRQARAFRARGELELARNAADQAMTFATTPTLRREIETLITSVSTLPARPLKDRWAKPGWAPLVQVLPLIAIVTGVSFAVTSAMPAPLTVIVRDFFESLGDDPAPPPAAASPAPSQAATVGRVYSVTVDNAALRTGPGTNYQMEAILKVGTLVLATEADPTGAWLRVVTPDGTTGFMATKSLSPNVSLDAIETLGTFGRAPRTPAAGDAAATR